MSALENQVTKIAQPLHPAGNTEARVEFQAKYCGFAVFGLQLLRLCNRLYSSEQLCSSYDCLCTSCHSSGNHTPGRIKLK